MGARPADLTGPYFLRYSLADSTRPWDHVGDDLDEAIAARNRKQAYFDALEANVPIFQDQDALGRGIECRRFYPFVSPSGLCRVRAEGDFERLR